jgi:host factor-I protein
MYSYLSLDALEEKPQPSEPESNNKQPKRMATPPQFIPKLVGQKVSIRLVSGGVPLLGTLTGYNPYELLVQTPKGQVVIFKRAIATIETVPEQKK